MKTTKQSCNRQELHEKLKKYALEEMKEIKNGNPNKLIEKLKSDIILRI